MTREQFGKWLDTFIEEKGIDLEERFEIEGLSGTNFMTVGIVIDHMKVANAAEQMMIHDRLVRLDFQNQPIVPFLKHLAQAIAI
jgi:hypothetical protein